MQEMGQPNGQMQEDRPERQGKMYDTMTEEAVQDAVVIIGNLLIHYVPIIALFDYDSTHTFIAKTFVDRIGVSVKDLGYYLVVSTPVGVVLTPGVCVRGVLSNNTSF